MYSTRTLYYLKQLGIRPWIKRPEPLFAVNGQTENGQEEIKLLVIIPPGISSKAHALLNQILFYSHLDKAQIGVLTDAANSPKQTPQAVLALGQLQKSVESEFKCPIFQLAHLEYFLENPKEKRQILATMMQVNQFILDTPQ